MRQRLAAQDSLCETLVRWFLQHQSPATSAQHDPQPLCHLEAYAALRVYAEATCLGHPWGLFRWDRVSHQRAELYCRVRGELGKLGWKPECPSHEDRSQDALRTHHTQS